MSDMPNMARERGWYEGKITENLNRILTEHDELRAEVERLRVEKRRLEGESDAANKQAEIQAESNRECCAEVERLKALLRDIENEDTAAHPTYGGLSMTTIQRILAVLGEK